MSSGRTSDTAMGPTSDTTETGPRACRKITYSNRSDSPGSCPTGNHGWSANQARLLTPDGARDAGYRTASARVTDTGSTR